MSKKEFIKELIGGIGLLIEGIIFTSIILSL